MATLYFKNDKNASGHSDIVYSIYILNEKFLPNNKP